MIIHSAALSIPPRPVRAVGNIVYRRIYPESPTCRALTRGACRAKMENRMGYIYTQLNSGELPLRFREIWDFEEPFYERSERKEGD